MDGVYQLTLYGLVVGTDGGNVYIKWNDNVLCQGWLRNGESDDTSTCTAIAELTEGDSVRVTGNSGDPADLRGGLQSGFTEISYLRQLKNFVCKIVTDTSFL